MSLPERIVLWVGICVYALLLACPEVEWVLGDSGGKVWRYGRQWLWDDQWHGGWSWHVLPWNLLIELAAVAGLTAAVIFTIRAGRRRSPCQ